VGAAKHEIDDGLGAQPGNRGAADVLDLDVEGSEQRAQRPALDLEALRPARMVGSDRDRCVMRHCEEPNVTAVR